MYGGAVVVVALLGAVAAAPHSSSNLKMLVAAPPHSSSNLEFLSQGSSFVFPFVFFSLLEAWRGRIIRIMRRCVETMALEQHHQDDKAEVCMVCLVLGRRKYKYVYIRKKQKYQMVRPRRVSVYIM
jgi:hypothetical protein